MTGSPWKPYIMLLHLYSGKESYNSQDESIDEGSGDIGGSGKVKSVTNATEVTNMVMTGSRKGENLFGKR